MKTNQILSILIAMIFVAGIYSCGGSGGGGVLSNTPSGTLKKVMSQLQDKKYEDAAKHFVRKDGAKLTEEEAKKVAGLMMMAEGEMAKKGGYKDVEIIGETISEDGNTATLKYKILFKEGSGDPEEDTLLKIDGDWYLTIGN